MPPVSPKLFIVIYLALGSAHALSLVDTQEQESGLPDGVRGKAAGAIFAMMDRGSDPTEQKLVKCFQNYEPGERSALGQYMVKTHNSRFIDRPLSPEWWWYHRCTQHMSGPGLNIEIFRFIPGAHKKFAPGHLETNYGCPWHEVQGHSEFLNEQRRPESVLMHIIVGEEYTSTRIDRRNCSRDSLRQRLDDLKKVILQACKLEARKIVVADFNKVGANKYWTCVPPSHILMGEMQEAFAMNPEYKMTEVQYACGNGAQQRNLFFVWKRIGLYPA